jgi:predicted TIM-barrel fold metal-dependent hydrolase
MILYASDYPHWDGTFPHSVTHIAERPELTETQKRKILRDNVARCYGLRIAAAAR